MDVRFLLLVEHETREEERAENPVANVCVLLPSSRYPAYPSFFLFVFLGVMLFFFFVMVVTPLRTARNTGLTRTDTHYCRFLWMRKSKGTIMAGIWRIPPTYWWLFFSSSFSLYVSVYVFLVVDPETSWCVL